MDPLLINKVLDLAIEIQQIPAPTFSEDRRAIFIQSLFQGERLSEVYRDEIGNVYADCQVPGKPAR
jgi:hypothetical protein